MHLIGRYVNNVNYLFLFHPNPKSLLNNVYQVGNRFVIVDELVCCKTIMECKSSCLIILVHIPPPLESKPDTCPACPPHPLPPTPHIDRPDSPPPPPHNPPPLGNPGNIDNQRFMIKQLIRFCGKKRYNKSLDRL